MKRKIKITTSDGKSIIGEISIRNKEFYDRCRQYHPTTVHRSKKDYCRKEKHKKDLRNDEDSFFIYVRNN